MANALYTKAKQGFLGAGIDLQNDTIKCTLIDTNDYTVNLSTDQYWSSIPDNAKVATQTLTTTSITDGVFDAGDVTFSSVTGDQSEALVIWKDTLSNTTSPLIAYIDTATGLPVTPNGGDITITWDSGANKIFALT